MATVFKFADGSRFTGNPQIVGVEFLVIKKKYGALTPTNIVDHARSTSSPLHRYFDWDNKKAAEKWRTQQARLLVCSIITVEIDGEETRPVRSFVSVNNNYESLEVVMSDAAMRMQALQDVKSAIGSLKEKLSAFEDFADVLSALDQVAKVAAKHFVKKARKSGERATAR